MVPVPSDYSQCSSGAAPGAGWSFSTLDMAFPKRILNPVGSHGLDLGDGSCFPWIGDPGYPTFPWVFHNGKKKSEVGNIPGRQFCQE